MTSIFKEAKSVEIELVQRRAARLFEKNWFRNKEVTGVY